MPKLAGGYFAPEFVRTLSNRAMLLQRERAFNYNPCGICSGAAERRFCQRPERCAALARHRRCERLAHAVNPRRRLRPMWCGRPDLNRHSSFEPRDFRTCYGFRRPHLCKVSREARFGVWTIPSPLRAFARFRCCPSSLYTFAAALLLMRLARDRL